MISCAALLATFLGGIAIDQIDKSLTYDIPQAAIDRMTWVERNTAKGCARAHGIRYRIRPEQSR